MRFDLITLFPEFFTSPLGCGLMSKALAKQIASVHITNPRDFTFDRHHKVDDESYGGGVGMVIKPEPIFGAIESLPILPRRQVLLMSPQGRTIDRALFQELQSDYDQLVLICGHYEGIDERVMNIVDREISLGDFVLTCGEIPALTLINGITRLLPGTVGKVESLNADSFEDGLLDYPHYTRPAEFRGWRVPDVLMSGNHEKIAKWRHQQQLDRTQTKRPDLYTKWLENIDKKKPPLS
ncbi:tRNA (guanosine(37)-N1)-methyltransferase TrmD [Chamaesiphon sp. VAR_48_metabat_135_sub]|uniref:tRNA (guanosine(37)-N1)-methyltransferase TrmD n=1 Tax=Chamaesiphon sp. VAR_48_metabat_135_sub TaxID=2964699 RepID=UPI00286A86DB|nr:tRNA (guanosine(37)-N1)-methyltransferase TrmD [Chamaesiphon sp. VAR_48_metabat_135_sub]